MPGRFSRMNASWNGRHVGRRDPQPAARARRHRAVGHPESVKRIRGPREAPRCRARSDQRRSREPEQLLGRLASAAGEGRGSHPVRRRSSPGSCLDKRQERTPRRVAIVEVAERAHRELHVIDRAVTVFSTWASESTGCEAHGTRPREVPSRPRFRGRWRTRGYPRSEGPRPARPNRRHTRRADQDAGRRAARSRPRARAERRSRDRAGRASGCAAVDQEHRDRAGPRRDRPLFATAPGRPVEHVQLEAARARGP